MSQTMIYKPTGDIGSDLTKMIRTARDLNQPVSMIHTGVELAVDPKVIEEAGRFQLPGEGQKHEDVMIAGAEAIHQELLHLYEDQVVINGLIKSLPQVAKGSADDAVRFVGKLARLSENPNVGYRGDLVAEALRQVPAEGNAKYVLDQAIAQLQPTVGNGRPGSPIKLNPTEGKLQPHIGVLAELHEHALGGAQVAHSEAPEDLAPNNRGRRARIRLDPRAQEKAATV